MIVTNPIADDPQRELERMNSAVEELRVGVDKMLEVSRHGDKEQLQVLEAYRMFANSKGWMRRMEEDIARGLSAEAAVEKEQSQARARMSQVQDAYLRERLSDLDDLSNRLLRILTGQGADTGAELPENPILIARNIGPGDLLEYGRRLRGIVLEEGSVGSHAAIVARALAIPLVVNAQRITTEALNGDHIMPAACARGVLPLSGPKIAFLSGWVESHLAAVWSSAAARMPAAIRAGMPGRAPVTGSRSPWKPAASSAWGMSCLTWVWVSLFFSSRIAP